MSKRASQPLNSSTYLNGSPSMRKNSHKACASSCFCFFWLRSACSFSQSKTPRPFGERLEELSTAGRSGSPELPLTMPIWE